MVVYACSPSIGALGIQKKGATWGFLNSQPSVSTELQASETHCLKKQGRAGYGGTHL